MTKTIELKANKTKAKAAPPARRKKATGNGVVVHRPQAPAVQLSESAQVMQTIRELALNPAVDAEKLDRLLSLQERVLTRHAKVAYDEAMSEMQKHLPVIRRDATIVVHAKDPKTGERTGPIQQSTPFARWETINEAIKPVLDRFGFALTFRTGNTTDGKILVTAIVSHKLGHREETSLPLMHDSTGSKNPVQAVGSSVSYGKRYTATSLLNITTRGDDDDGDKGGATGGGIKVIDQKQLDQLIELCDTVSADKIKFCEYVGIDSLADLPASRFEEAVSLLNRKAK